MLRYWRPLTTLRFEVSAEFRTTPNGDRRPSVQLGSGRRLLPRWPSRGRGSHGRLRGSPGSAPRGVVDGWR